MHNKNINVFVLELMFISAQF